MLISYGDFLEMGHKLVPVGYCEEWYALELEKAIVDLFGLLDIDKAASFSGVESEIIFKILNNRLEEVGYSNVVMLSDEFNIPLHPSFTYYWNAISR
ncbi:MAG: hypothetical protein U9O94_08875, partial [Nanoarchaeota archaeon]|nr:hypothetical protein [Nanoarchaeota archaeon]